MTVVVVGFCGIMLEEMIMIIILADMRLVIDSSSSGHLRNGKQATQVDPAGRPPQQLPYTLYTLLFGS